MRACCLPGGTREAPRSRSNENKDAVSTDTHLPCRLGCFIDVHSQLPATEGDARPYHDDVNTSSSSNSVMLAVCLQSARSVRAADCREWSKSVSVCVDSQPFLFNHSMMVLFVVRRTFAWRCPCTIIAMSSIDLGVIFTTVNID